MIESLDSTNTHVPRIIHILICIHTYVPGLGAWASLDRAARRDKPSKTDNPKKTTAFNRTHTVCMICIVSTIASLSVGRWDVGT